MFIGNNPTRIKSMVHYSKIGLYSNSFLLGCQCQNQVIIFFLFGKRFSHAFKHHASFCSLNQLWAPCFSAEICTFLIGTEPAISEHKGHIPILFTSKIRLLPKLSFQQLQALYGLCLCRRPLLFFFYPYFFPIFI